MSLTFIFYAWIETLSYCLPLSAAYRIGETLAGFVFFISSAERRMVERNLKCVGSFRSARRETGRNAALDVYKNFSRTCVELLYYGNRPAALNTSDLVAVNLEALDCAWKSGNGVVLVSAHLGNWELAAMALSRWGYPISVIANPHRDPRVDRLYMKKRQNHGIRVLPRIHAFRAACRSLARNEMVGIIGDRRYGARGATVTFFGRQVRLPQGAAALARRAGAPVVGVYAMPTRKQGGFELHFFEPIDPRSETSRQSLHQRVAAVLEEMISRHPLHWFAFEEMFDVPQQATAGAPV